MGVSITKPEAVVSTGTTLSLAQYISQAGTGTPAYIVLSALDRNEYTVAATGGTGCFTGNNARLGLSSIGGDARAAGIVFSWNAATHQYVNATYGALSQLSWVTSGSVGDVTNLAVFGTSNLAQAQQDAANPYYLLQDDPGGYDGSVSFITDPTFTGAVPAAATQDGVAAAAMRFVGQAWNDNGCWVLASTVAAEAGASLPLSSTLVDQPGQGNGEWFVLYDGPVAANANWSSLVSTGDIVCFGTPGGGGHITTCVSGSGASAMLVDNITYETATGQIANSANDGSPNDIIVAAPHAASQEWQGVSASQVVIYALDAPLVTAKPPGAAVSAGTSLSLATLFSATDPAGHGITEYQITASQPGDPLSVAGATNSTIATLTATSLSQVSLLASVAGTDTVNVRAYNGAYWGDWTADSLTIAAATPLPPVLAQQTPSQTWQQSSHVSLVLPAGTFTDPQHGTLTYSATLAGGGALPSWLSFNAAARSFSGTVPGWAGTLSIAVTATDAAGLSSHETFTATVPASAPVLAVQESEQSVHEGSGFTFTLAAASFKDPQGQALSYTAALSNGGTLPSWLVFSASSLSFSGTAPSLVENLTICLTATDTSHLSAKETFELSITKPLTSAGHLELALPASPELFLPHA